MHSTKLLLLSIINQRPFPYIREAVDESPFFLSETGLTLVSEAGIPFVNESEVTLVLSESGALLQDEAGNPIISEEILI